MIGSTGNVLLNGVTVVVNSGLGPVVTSLTAPVIDNITGAPQLGVPTFLGLAVIVLDRVTKSFVLKYVFKQVDVTSFFSITRLMNRGVSSAKVLAPATALDALAHEATRASDALLPAKRGSSAYAARCPRSWR